jgi:protein-L-isoaspartate O-methyltransferase
MIQFVPWILVGIVLFATILATILVIKVFWGFYILTQGAFYAGSSNKRIERILKLAKIKKGDKVIDLGSGDGRLLVAMANKGAIAKGIELDPVMVRKSKRLIQNNNLEERVTIHFGNYWREDLSQYDVVVVYGIKHIMAKLEKKLLKEAKKNAKIISVHFTFPNLTPVKKINDVRLYSIIEGASTGI